MAEEPTQGRGAEGDDNLRPHSLDLREKVGATQRDLIGLRRPVVRRAALDDIRDVRVLSIKAGILQGLVQDLARCPNEGTSGGVFVSTRGLADHEQRGIDGPLSRNRLGASGVETAPCTGPHGRGGLIENPRPLLGPDRGARGRRDLIPA
jgi:hypothetical protein